MNNSINITSNDNQYQVCKWFQNHVPHLVNYLVKTIGVNHLEKKYYPEKIKEGKKPARSIKTSLYKHILRKLKGKLILKNHIHENANLQNNLVEEKMLHV